MDLFTIHLLEYLAVIFGFLAILTRIRPQLMVLSVIFQVLLFLVQLISTYLKNNKGKQVSVKLFLAEIMHHYFKTNPKGKKLAKFTNLDIKIEKVLNEDNLKGLKHDSEVNAIG